ncbi:type III secretion system stator protein SctL [Pseudomonas typographi]|uniref:Type III secretion system stator protein SctL n=1 Tax=Pseudomonas typographi TaxID=2715964 RepID=A0ABR7Z2Q3_9PSED|nr:type III secretion system stator protein SctL [Pseudomonas typographi]MBD1554537.1 type III secretion system stator protein SctL [Pseudomonas typographi]MBD1599773.1 type III secretion system stator protein SctL [Pseudomonas typographi]
MLTKRTLSLGTPVIAEPILRHEDIANSQRAQEVLAHARDQAERIRAEATLEARQQIDQAVGQFWAGANAFLQGFDEERAAFRGEALASVEQLLNVALSRLLDDTDLAERTRALLRDLAASQPVDSAATLSCHPDLAPTVGEWLSHSRFATLWRLEGNSAMPTNALKLSHATGAFDVDWNRLREGLLAPYA